MKSCFRLLLSACCAAVATAYASIPPDPPQRWWKGNLHTHTFWSDGNAFPEMAVDWYVRNGYHFLSLTDHNILSRGTKWIDEAAIARRAGEADALGQYLERFGRSWVETRTNAAGALEVRLKPLNEYRALFESPGRFLLIEGEEITDGADNGKSIHMNALNQAEYIDPPGGPTVREVIRRALRLVREQSARTGRPILFHVNHLNYKWGVTAEDLASIVDTRFFEIWNGVDGDNDPGDATHPSTDEIWDVANTLRVAMMGAAPLYGIATDDTHEYHGLKTRAVPGRAWVRVRATHLTPESLIRAMHRGDFYASTGVVLNHVTHVRGKRLSIGIAAAPGVRYTTEFIGTRRGVNLEGEPRRNAAGEIVETTLDYNSDSGPVIGEVLAVVEGPNPVYTFTGDELYVRARIRSDRAPKVPSTEYPLEQAWTQPVGWKRHLEKEDGGR